MERGAFVVTTRSRLRTRAFLPSMLFATRRVMRDLRADGDAVRAASVIAEPREFWSVSVWPSLHLMQEFMRSGAHGQHLWEVGDLLDSFWLLRWRATQHELGSWDGLTLAPAPATPPSDPVDPVVREQVLASLPRLRAAFDVDGRPTHAAAPETRAARDEVAGAAAVVVRLPASRVLHRRGRQLRWLRRLVEQDPEVTRVVTGRAQQGGDAWLLAVWRDGARAGRLLDGEPLQELVATTGAWACELQPQNEFGHWDGLRLRDDRDGRPPSGPPHGIPEHLRPGGPS